MPRSLTGFIMGSRQRIIQHHAADLRLALDKHLPNRYVDLHLALYELEQDMVDEANRIQDSYPDDPEPDPNAPDL